MKKFHCNRGLLIVIKNFIAIMLFFCSDSKNIELQLKKKKKITKLNCSKIKFYVAFFNGKSNVSDFHHGTKHVKLNFNDI